MPSVALPSFDELQHIASVAHEANRAYGLTLGDTSQLPWPQAPAWQRASEVEGVAAIAEGRVTRPEQAHDAWLAERTREGWTYGAVKNVDTKEHPALVPYAELPADQQRKDRLFFAVVKALL